jgi:hypothetical protein
MKALFGIVLASALTLPATGAMANVVYALKETFFVPAFAGTLTVPDFISSDTTFPVTDFSVSNNPASQTHIEFAPNTSSECSLFGLSSCDLIVLSNAAGFAAFGYHVGTFSTTGTNTARLGASSMILTVSQTTPVPEPSTWAMMALGFAGLGFVGWRSRRQGVSIAA